MLFRGVGIGEKPPRCYFSNGGNAMKKELLETGKIVSTHGLHGEVKILPWADSPEFLLEFDRVFL